MVISASKFMQYKYIRCTEESCIHFSLHPGTEKPNESSIVTEGMELNSDMFNPVTEFCLLICIRPFVIFSFKLVSI